MIHIQVAGKIQFPYDLSRLKQAARETLRYTHSPTRAELTLVVTDDAQLQQLNRDFLGIDAPTDVLAFPAGFTDPDSQQPYLGDILISLPRAEEQAAAHQHEVQAELLLLAVHGTLHLLGFDHAAEEEQAVMWAAQTEILKRLG